MSSWSAAAWVDCQLSSPTQHELQARAARAAGPPRTRAADGEARGGTTREESSEQQQQQRRVKRSRCVSAEVVCATTCEQQTSS